MTIDLARPDHRDALRLACVVVDKRPHVASEIREDVTNFGATTPRHLAVHALSSPKQSAALVRALAERCGVSAHAHDSSVEFRVGNNMAYIDLADGPMVDRCPPWVSALILALLACTTREAALAALREHGQ